MDNLDMIEHYEFWRGDSEFIGEAWFQAGPCEADGRTGQERADAFAALMGMGITAHSQMVGVVRPE